ncbi:MAG: LPS export ABC transporter permease LptF [Hyphomicrobiaceae bacterium]
MRLISKYVFRQAASAVMLILSSLGGIVWIALALKELNVVTSEGNDVIMLVKITSLALPNLLAVIAPFALLIATMHTLNRLGGDSELIVLTASGSPVWELARPLLALAFMVSIGVGIVNHVVQPWSLQKLKSYIVQMRADLLSKVIQPGRFSSPEADLAFHIRARDMNGDLRGLMVSDRRKKEEDRVYLAERAVITKQDETAYMILSDGHILRRSAVKTAPQIVVFDQYIVNLDDFDRQSGVGPIDFKPRERYLHQLLYPEETSNLYKKFKGQFRAELHERFAAPLYPIAFVLIALAAVGQAQSTRENRTERLVFGFLIAVALRLAGFAANTLVVKSGAMTVLMYLLPLGAIAGAAISLKRGTRPHSRYSISDAVQERFGPVLARLSPLRWRGPQPASTGPDRS